MNIINNVKISEISSWKTGGHAKYIININSVEDYLQTVKFSEENSINILVIGKTTNLLFCDSNINAALVRLGDSFDFIHKNRNEVEIGASSYAPFVVRKLQQLGLSGLEHIVGIPATIGGLVYMNGGSQRKTISECITKVKSINKLGEVIVRDFSKCKFSYRSSIFNDLDELIISVTVKLKDKRPSLIRKECLTILSSRRKKFPRKLPNCGSVFKSSPDLFEKFGPPGKIIEDLDLKGTVRGGAKISTHHANFITNENRGSSRDILELIFMIKDKVKNEYNTFIETEVIYVNESGELKSINDIYQTR
ncbi:UDP-N-acetylmuramate dehydrogenase [Photobacterium sp. ZSDE20]|uniref:UDP-N-acetylenolpyruvoylglucosamine reductase n=1 Tax=Photobacterium pectinilyticum TaxID=2906793 RepID=A0ABT1N5K5_9GAMM|nr:UDP-N-acetylmuramate dehydrogenase [Photobacterium sp. ZSDE20]MCQ1060022.1 UDP-N-acetylmuramate dehydrogenase [Photobacterium sp. ZSDE20]MDD1826955.1 UDP-N-acetylmuramate dehydrogenase [Photobacterium sp. ZSDE20]